MLFLVYKFPLFPFQVGVVNNFLHSLFKQVDVFLKEKQVTQATSTYAYRAYLETLLNYSPSAITVPPQKIPSLKDSLRKRFLTRVMDRRPDGLKY
jgi:hypothetical protein